MADCFHNFCLCQIPSFLRFFWSDWVQMFQRFPQSQGESGFFMFRNNQWEFSWFFYPTRQYCPKTKVSQAWSIPSGDCVRQLPWSQDKVALWAWHRQGPRKRFRVKQKDWPNLINFRVIWVFLQGTCFGIHKSCENWSLLSGPFQVEWCSYYWVF